MKIVFEREIQAGKKEETPVEDFTVDRTIALRENLYCRKCGRWVYCPEMNEKCENDPEAGRPAHDYMMAPLLVEKGRCLAI